MTHFSSSAEGWAGPIDQATVAASAVFDWVRAYSGQPRVPAALSAQAVPGAPKEVLKYAAGPFFDRPGWQKYANTVEWGEGTVYRWSSGRATLLNYWGGTHFYGTLEPVQANQRREKVVGPWLLYANATQADGATGQDQLWQGAKQRLGWEKAAWPYAWQMDPRYLPRAGRGTVEGRLVSLTTTGRSIATSLTAPGRARAFRCSSPSCAPAPTPWRSPPATG